MSFPIILTQNDVSSDSNSVFVKRFTTPLQIKDCDVFVSSASIPYSWPNVSTALDNNSFSYIYDGTTYPVDLGNNVNLSIDDVNNALRNTFIQNGHYMEDVHGLKYFFIEISLSLPIYKFLFEFRLVQVPDGGTNITGMTVTNETMQLIIPATNVRDLLGLNGQTVPTVPSPLIQNVTSDYYPQIAKTICVNIALPNMVSNFQTSSIPGLVTTIPITAPFGSLINHQSILPLKYRCIDGSYSEIRLNLVNQHNESLGNLDPNCVIVLQFTPR